MTCRGWLGFLAGLGAAVLLLGGTASANPKYAAYVIHSDTGDVLFDRYANETRYPASLTKMMTLYLLFEAVEEGKTDLNTKMVVSKRASLQPASKLGVKRGSRISVETAIDALVIRSANDVATVVAEHLGGTESAFARKMTAKARALGMRRTTFRNASGLPDSRQKTTARDMAILSQRLVQDFPHRLHFFDKDRFTWNGRTYRSHNRVTTRFDGADGLKTGYTRASGYNLATTAKRGDHRLIGIVLGGRSGATRDRHMESILNTAFADIRRTPTLISAIHRVKPVPSLRPDRREDDAPVLLASAEKPTVALPSTKPTKPDPAPVKAANAATLAAANAPKAPAKAEDSFDLAALEAAIAEAADEDAGLIGEGDAAFDLPRDWAIQVGAFRNQPQAIARIHDTQELVRGVWSDVGREVNIAQRGDRAIYRARFTRLTEPEALALCERISDDGEDCMALRAR